MDVNTKHELDIGHEVLLFLSMLTQYRSNAIINTFMTTGFNFFSITSYLYFWSFRCFEPVKGDDKTTGHQVRREWCRYRNTKYSERRIKSGLRVKWSVVGGIVRIEWECSGVGSGADWEWDGS